MSAKVRPGKLEIPNKKEEASKLEQEEYRLRVMMIKKKNKGLYKSMMKSRKKREKEAQQLQKKRQVHDEKVQQEKFAKQKKSKNLA